MSSWYPKYIHKFWNFSVEELIELRKDPNFTPAIKGVITRLINSRGHPTKIMSRQTTKLQYLAQALNRYKGSLKWFDSNTHNFLQEHMRHNIAIKDREVAYKMSEVAGKLRAIQQELQSVSDQLNTITTLCPEKRKHVKKPS
jgi:hypothetical protein